MKQTLLILAGLFPFIVLAQTDAGVVSIDSVRGRCAGNIDVYARVQNFGIGTLSTFDVNWQIDGNPQTAASFAGNVAPGGTTLILLGSTMINAGVQYSFVAWTSSPNGTTDSNTSNDSAFADDVEPGLWGLYSIGAFGDFASFSDAASALMLRGMCGGVEFIVDSGIYTERVTLKDVTGISAANPLQFRSAMVDSSTVILQWPSSALLDSNYVISLEDVGHVSFHSITFARTGTSENSTAVQMLGATDDIGFFRSRFIGPSNITGANTTGTKSGIFNAGTADWDGLEVRNCYFLNNANGIWVNGSTTHNSLNTIITDNIFETFYVGAFILYQDAPQITGNIFMRDNSSAAADYFAISLRYGEGAVQVINNRITGYTGSYGIRLRAFNVLSPQRGLVANNFVQVGSSGTGRGIALEESSSEIDVFHNSVNYTGASATLGRAFFADGVNSADFRVLNNIFANTGGGYASYVTSNAVPAIVSSNHNCLFTTGTTLAFFGAAYSDLSALQSSTATEAQSVSGDPLFVSTTDLHASAGILANAGSSIPAIAFDIDGDARDTLYPDIGADEFTLVSVPHTLAGELVAVYPNPAHHTLTINKPFGRSELAMIDMTGKIVYTTELPEERTSDIQLPALPEGVYLLRIVNQSATAITRVVVNRP
jgi:trimeric autotransporter adhesin